MQGPGPGHFYSVGAMGRVQTFHLDTIAVLRETGDIDAAQTLATLRAAFEADSDAVLFDCRSARKTTTFGDVIRLVGMVKDEPAFHEKRFAVVTTYYNQFEQVQLFEAVASAAGMSIRAFLDRDEAIAWLGAEQGASLLL